MKVLRSIPSALAAVSCWSPEPSTNRKSSGWTSEVTIRIRSLRKRISSRLQTILIARSSLRRLRAGTRTCTTSAGGDRLLVVVDLQPHTVRADSRLQGGGGVEGNDLAAVHDRDPIAELGLVHVMGGHEDRDVFRPAQLADVAPDRAPRLRVKSD